MDMALPSRARIIEGYWPLFLGAASGVGAWFFAVEFLALCAKNQWDASVLYFAVFDLSAVFTAFIFTFYSFVLNAESGFIGRMKKTFAYRETVEYTISALVLGALLIAASVPMMVISPAPTIGTEIAARCAVSLWFGLTMWTVGAFVRAAYLFSIFAGQHK